MRGQQSVRIHKKQNVSLSNFSSLVSPFAGKPAWNNPAPVRLCYLYGFVFRPCVRNNNLHIFEFLRVQRSQQLGKVFFFVERWYDNAYHACFSRTNNTWRVIECLVSFLHATLSESFLKISSHSSTRL